MVGWSGQVPRGSLTCISTFPALTTTPQDRHYAVPSLSEAEPLPLVFNDYWVQQMEGSAVGKLLLH